MIRHDVKLRALLFVAGASLLALMASQSVRSQMQRSGELTRDFRAQGGNAPQAGVLYFVNTTSDTVVAGACTNGLANCSLRGAIQSSNSHVGEDGIEFDLPAGSVINLTQALPDIADSVSIFGPGPTKLTVRRATTGAYRIFNVTTSGVVTLSGLSISNGFIDSGSGGGVQNAGSGTLNVLNCTISDNTAVASASFVVAVGGGISNFGTLNVTNSTLLANTTRGFSSGSPSAAYGGGIFSLGNATIRNSTISGNSALGGDNLGGTDDPGGPGSGGGIYSSGETLNIVNSTVANNLVLGGRAGSGLAGLGGGYGLGGGIFNGNGNLIVTNSTISDNSATGGESSGSASTGIGSGGGIYNPADATAKSTIIAENASSDNDPDAFGTFASQGFNLIGKSDGATGFNQATDLKGTVASPLDPKLDPNGLQNNGGPTQTIALESGSPAIDQGTSSGLTGSLTTDQRGTGFPRTADYSNFANAAGGDGTDIGAFEFWTLKITSITRLANGYIRLQGLGVPNAVHTLHSSPDLSPNSFGAITTVNANGIGALQYDDAGAVGLTKRFYRLAFP